MQACTGEGGEGDASSGASASASGTATTEAATTGATSSSSGGEATTGATSSSSGGEAATEGASTTAAAPSCPAHAVFDCVTPIGCDSPNAPCGGCQDIFGADGCLRPVCDDDQDCGPGERCASIPTFLNLICHEIDGACVCGGDPLSGALDMCVADDCP